MGEMMRFGEERRFKISRILNSPLKIALLSLLVSEVVSGGLTWALMGELPPQTFIIAGVCGFFIAYGMSFVVFRYQKLVEEKNDQLEHLAGELQQSKDELELRVEARTQSLRQANERIEESLREKEVLLQEIHHRVKNNLQIITSFLDLQAGGITDQKILEQLVESRNRILSMALIHEKLYESTSLERVDFGTYVRNLITELGHSYGLESTMCIEVEVEDLALDIDAAIPCGLIVNELVSNAFKYAFEPGQEGRLGVRMSREANGDLNLVVSDDGVGFPDGFVLEQASTLGMLVVRSLVRQLRGEMSLGAGRGAEIRIRFPGPVEKSEND
jgi:two-component sensor histidine kinase